MAFSPVAFTRVSSELFHYRCPNGRHHRHFSSLIVSSYVGNPSVHRSTPVLHSPIPGTNLLSSSSSSSSSSSPSPSPSPSSSPFYLRMSSSDAVFESSSENQSKPKSCVPCEGLDASALLSPERVREFLAVSPMWSLNDDGALSRSFVAKDFQRALDALNAFGAVAEREGHHPDFHLTGYRNVEVVLFTHSLGGVTENDLTLASILDEEVEVTYSPKWLRQHPEAVKRES